MQTKKFYMWDDRPPINYRPGTSDEAIIDSVLIKKTEYNFPAFEPKICFDIGGNIGVVAVLLANIYPQSTIISFEPVAENFDLLVLNSKGYPNIRPINSSLGLQSGSRRIYASDDNTNLGGFSTHILSNKHTLI